MNNLFLDVDVLNRCFSSSLLLLLLSWLFMLRSRRRGWDGDAEGGDLVEVVLGLDHAHERRVRAARGDVERGLAAGVAARAVGAEVEQRAHGVRVAAAHSTVQRRAARSVRSVDVRTAFDKRKHERRRSGRARACSVVQQRRSIRVECAHIQRSLGKQKNKRKSFRTHPNCLHQWCISFCIFRIQCIYFRCCIIRTCILTSSLLPP